MRKLIACLAVLALTGCQTLQQWVGPRTPAVKSRPVLQVQADCKEFVVEMAGWPVDTFAVVGIGSQPPYALNAPAGTFSGSFAVTSSSYQSVGSYGWSIGTNLGKPSERLDVGVVGPCYASDVHS